MDDKFKKELIGIIDEKFEKDFLKLFKQCFNDCYNKMKLKKAQSIAHQINK